MLQIISRRTFSVLNKVPMGKPDPIFGSVAKFNADKSSRKVNLSICDYRDQEGNPVQLQSVQRADCILEQENVNHEYPPIEGLQAYIDASIKLAYGADFYASNCQNIAGNQVLGGTGALRLGFEFIQQFLPKGTVVYVPNPTWYNHQDIIRVSNLLVKQYQYFDEKLHCVNFKKLMMDLSIAPNGSVILFHACAHNPTGTDLTLDQWKEILVVVKKRQFIPFFDMAYQGFISGDVEKDAEAVRMFAKEGVLLMLGQSYAKIMALSGQRLGCLSVLCENENEKNKVHSQLSMIQRALWSSPPLYGARIAEKILNIPELKQQWLGEIQAMTKRTKQMRGQLVSKLKSFGSSHDWSYLDKQVGIFAYTGLNQLQVQELREKHHVYILNNGRLTISGINEGNIDYIASAIHEVNKL